MITPMAGKIRILKFSEQGLPSHLNSLRVHE
nr:MAG TPA: hypothetical protein [Caudoviricetes sp.]